MSKKGIDLSSWQSNVDWSKVAKQVNFVILRSGFGNSTSQIDNMFEYNIKNAIKNGVKYIGIYHFSYAHTVAEAEREAKVCLEIIEPYKKYINLPVAFDWEYDSYNWAVKQGVTPTRALCDNMAKAFCSVIEKAGYKTMLYTNPDYLSRFFTQSKYKYLWIAQYSNRCQIDNVDVWQYSDGGKIDGIIGNVDMDICYNDSWFFTPNAKVKKKTSYIRQKAYVGAKIEEILVAGSEIKVLSDLKNGWSKVQYNDTIGYLQNTRINKEGLSKYKTATVTKPFSPRMKMDINSDKLQKLKVGDKFTIICLNPDTNWYLINVNGKDCYCRNQSEYFKINK